jgi:hypothetical protein
MKNRQTPPRQKRWQKSAEFKAIGRAAILKFNAEFWRRPRCGARRKYDGQPCQHIGLANGRCRFHGGKTPKGKQWHKETLPIASGSVTKLDKKLNDLERRRKKRARRVEAMTQEERERYDAWQRSHKPGGPGDRQRARWDREARKRIAEMLRDEEPDVFA